MADQAVSEEHYSYTTPRGALSRQPQRRKIVTTSPLSGTARHLLLVKCAAADQQPETTVPATQAVSSLLQRQRRSR